MEATMQAIGFRRYGMEDVLERLTVAKPTLEPNEVLVRIAAAGVNPADSYIRSGRFRFIARSKLPFVPGADIAGVVADVGSAVTRFQSGNSVYAMLPNLGGGGYAEYVTVAEDAVALVPSNLSLAEAAAVPLAGLTALQALRDTARLKSGDHVLIYGASGGVGSFGVQIAKAMGARVSAACSGRNRDLVRSLGANEVLDYTEGDITAGNRRYDLIFDAVGLLSFWRMRRILSSDGSVVTVNPVRGNIALRGLARVMGSQRLHSLLVQPSGADLETLGEWIVNGQVRPVIDQCYPLAEAASAQHYSASNRVRGKLVLVVDTQLAARRGGAAPRS